MCTSAAQGRNKNPGAHIKQWRDHETNPGANIEKRHQRRKAVPRANKTIQGANSHSRPPRMPQRGFQYGNWGMRGSGIFQPTGLSWASLITFFSQRLAARNAPSLPRPHPVDHVRHWGTRRCSSWDRCLPKGFDLRRRCPFGTPWPARGTAANWSLAASPRWRRAGLLRLGLLCQRRP